MKILKKSYQNFANPTIAIILAFLCAVLTHGQSLKVPNYGLVKAASAYKTEANTYNFTHKYSIQINDGRRTTDMEYYINQNQNYFASRIPEQRESIDATIMDVDTKKMHILMNNGNKKSRMSMRLNLNKVTKLAIDESNVTITPTGTTKKILGYNCEGFKVEGEDVEGTVWVTQNAGVSFMNAFFRSSTNSTDPIWKKLQTGLTLEMDMIDTSRRRPKPINMKCIELKEFSVSFNLDDYKKII